jgi:hypothetical protein
MAIRQFDVSTPVRRHFQDNSYYCGAACAQMAIAAQPTSLVDQAELFDAVSSPSGWMTAPDDLSSTLNRYVTGASYGVVSHGRSRVAVMRRVAWSMCRYGRPAMALVHGGEHWVVIDSLSGTVEDDAPPEYQPVITDVIVRDPAPDLSDQRESLYVTEPTPPPHEEGDLCSGAAYQEECYTWSGWEQVFSRCDVAGEWDTKWVVVCVPQDEPRLRAQAGLTTVPPDETDGGAATPSGQDAPRAIESHSNANLLRVATEGLRNSSVSRRNWWEDAIGAVAGCWVRLVHHLDRGDAYYLLILQDRSGRGRLLARIDVGSLRLLHAVLEPSPKLVEHLQTLPDERGALVWTPCREARSPFFPLIQSRDRRQPRYRRLNGQPVERLSLARTWVRSQS